MLPAMLHWASDRWRFRYALGLAARAALAAHCKGQERDIVLVPCWRRAEMLWHCLDNLCNADGVEFARGLSNYSSADAGRLRGRHTAGWLA